jgi:Ras-related protein Rab-21
LTYKNSFPIFFILGQEKFHALGPIYYRNSQGAILVYDISCEDSFQKIKVWIKELKKIVGNDIVLIIVGNKKDLLKDKTVTYDLEMHEAYAKSVGASHFLSSAKLNENIDEVFIEISKNMIKVYNEKQPPSSTVNRSGSMRRQLLVEQSPDQEDEQQQQQQHPASSCCMR